MASDKPNPFMKLLEQGLPKKVAPATAPVATPKVEEKNTLESTKEGLTSPSTSVSLGAGVTEKPGFDLAAASKQFMTPAAMQLLKAGGSRESEVSTGGLTLEDESGNAYEATSSNELATLDTESFEAKTQRETNTNVAAAQFGAKLVLESAESVTELCERIDRLIVGNENLVGPSLGETRNYVQQLMITLKSRPEFDSVVLDKDVKNVMRFIRATREEALALREIKTVKKVTRATNKEKKANGLKGIESAFAAIMSGGLKK